ncbi:ABC transporter substrate-binding protein [Mycobacterium sp. IS-1496]|uniref:metal ABC transporter solute-binding protein, Zn/Mn family n=1 Tax=Mycobacterium sp. IS-1496 TaxID=1772284 RepID=UPI00074167BB|nr:zinc ABC transporter substrate-binding protein [Mycobacterium sp. IS-1496]KUI35480.1 ABC transporter substrate-binding protein [Mycobacterium sp. IS-1496]
MTACSSGDDAAAPSVQPGGDCPAEPVSVVVSVDQWGDIVSQLGGQCAKVSTVVASSSVDPHDFEPAPKDAALFEGAQLIVVNGGHYDEWASKLAASSAADAAVVNALEVSGSADAGEANPHAWYNPAAVTAVADAVSAELVDLAPDAADYFAERQAEVSDALAPYHQVIGSIKATASGKTYAATESVFDDMAAAVGLTNRTPQGYQVAAANESDPSPADLDAFLRLLSDRGVDVLIYNVQTEGSVPQQIRSAAEQAGVPVVEVTESMPPDAASFQTWQVDQLSALAEALGVGGG